MDQSNSMALRWIARAVVVSRSWIGECWGRFIRFARSASREPAHFPKATLVTLHG